MRLARLDLTRYGKFTDRSIDFGGRQPGRPDFHIVYGPNEAGKSTAFSAILDLLYGIEERSRYGFLHAYGAMEIGAALDIAGQRHELRRVKQRSGSLRDATGQPVGEALLAGALTGLSREAYRLMFSLDDQTLEDGGNAILDSKGDLGELLFSASAGLAGLSRALAAVTTQADGIFRKRASSTEIASLKRRLAELKADRDAIDTQAGAYAALVAGLRQARQDYDEAATERGRLKAACDEVAGLLRAAPVAAEYADLGERLSAMAGLPRPPDHWATQVPTLMVEQALLKAKLGSLTERLARLALEIENTAPDEPVLRLSARIEALASAAARYRVAAIDLPKRRMALVEIEARLAAFTSSIPGLRGAVDPDTLVMEPGRLATLRTLIERWSGIEATAAAVTAELEAASNATDQAIADLARLEREQPLLPPALKARLQGLVTQIRDADLLARYRVAAGAAKTRAQPAADAFAALSPWSGTLAELVSLNIPTAEAIARWRSELVELERRSARHHEQQRLAGSDRIEVAARIAAAEAAMGSIAEGEAGRLRQERDQAWATHRSLLTQDSAALFEQAMRDVDAMSDARLAAADRLAQLLDLRRDLAVCDAKASRETALLAEVAEETAVLAGQITAVLPEGIAKAAPTLQDKIAVLADWALRRERALAAAREASAAEHDLRHLEGEIEREQAALALAVAEAGIPAEGLDLGALLQAADAIFATGIARALTVETAQKAVRDTTRSLDARRRALAEAQATSQSWAEHWSQTLAGTRLAGCGLDREAVRTLLDPLARLPAMLAERDDIHHRIESMEADQSGYLAELVSLRAMLGEEGGELSADMASDLAERLGAASRAREQRFGKETEWSELDRARQALLTDIAVHDASRNEVTRFFGVAELTEVAEQLSRCAARDHMEAERRKLEAHILRETGAASLEAALTRIGAMEPGDRARQHAEDTARLEHLDERLRLLFAARAAAQDKVKAVGGDDAVLRIEAERRTVTLQIEERAVQFLQLRTGTLLAERALEIYREKHRGSMMRRASEAFRAMTCDAYSGLATRPEKDRDTLIGIAGAGSKLATDMSKGTRFQLYLALRLAGYEEFATTRPPVPFIADDIMETFDEPRSEQVLVQFGAMAMTGQVIYLTHHRHICDLARRAVPDVVVHELPSSAL